MRKWGIVGLVSLMLFASLTIKATRADAETAPLNISAKAAILVNFNTGKILYAKNADKPMSPASMTKMMTEYLVLEAIENGDLSWDTKVSISDYAYEISQNYQLSNVPLLKNVQYTIEELYKAMVIESANGATIALAEAVAGSEAQFVKMMNQKARELGLQTFKFVNSTGLNNSSLSGKHPAGGPNEENMMSARATAKLAYHLIKDHPEVLKYTSIKKALFKTGFPEGRPFEMENWNWMLPGFVYGYEGVDGLKTGTTEKAGYCFTATAKGGDTRLISVVMKASSYEERFNETRKLLNFGFHQFKEVTLIEKGQTFQNYKTLPVTKGKKDRVHLAAKEALQIVVREGTADQYQTSVRIDRSKLNSRGMLVAPVKKGVTVGTIAVDGPETASLGYITKKAEKRHAFVPLVTTEAIEKANWFVLLFRGVSDFFSGIWANAVDSVKSLF